MAGPGPSLGLPVDAFEHSPHDDSYRISGRDMAILQKALQLKIRNEGLEAELVFLRQRIEELGG